MTPEAVVRQERPSRNDFLIHDPEAVMQRSLVYRKLDQANFNFLFGPNGEKFSPQTLAENPPDVLLVEDEANTDGPGYRIMIFEGHHRLTAAVLHRRNVNQGYQVPGHNVTQQYTQERFLTPIEAFTILFNHERGHEALAPERTAARILSDWPTMVGSAIAEDFPGFAALFRLGMTPVQFRTAKAFEYYVTNPDPRTPLDKESREVKLFATETPEKRKKVEIALIALVGALEKRKVASSDVMYGAIAFIKEQGLEDQVQGLLCFPEVEAKNTEGALDDVAVNDRKRNLSLVLTDSFAQVSSRAEIRALYETLVSPDLTYEQTCAILQPQEDSTIVDRLNSIKAEKARNTLATTYAEQGRESLTEEHFWILDLLSSQTGVIPLIDRTIMLCNRAQTVLAGIPGGAARQDIERKLQIVRTTRSKASLTKGLNELSKALDSKPKPRGQTIFPSREARVIHHLLIQVAPLLESSGPLTIPERNALNELRNRINQRLNRMG